MNKSRLIKARSNLLAHDSKLVKIKTEQNNAGVVKILVFAVLVLLQLGIALYLYFRYVAVFKWYAAIALILSILTCIYVLSTDKNSQSKAVWIIFLLLGSSVGFIFYILSDDKLLFARHRRRYKNIFAETEKYTAENADVTSASPEVKNDVNYLASADFTVYNDTELKYYPSGAEFFDDVLDCLKTAEKFVFMEFFIVVDGVLLNRTLDVLAEKAANGVDVRIIYDDVGSRSLTASAKKRIKALGIKLVPFNRLIPRFNVALNYRDHRKIVVVDGKTAFTGGVNLADEYVNEKRMYGYWKDTGIRIKGAAVDGLCHIFLRQWQFISKIPEDYSQYYNLYEHVNSSAVCVPYADGIDYAQPIGKNVYINLIAGAKQKLYIMTPYFVVDDAITALLIAKAKSGVDVRLVLPEVADKGYVYRVSRNSAEKLIDSGVKLYCMRRSFVHAKVMLTENAATVGSVNLDLRSFYQQFEVGIYTDDDGVMADILNDFEQTFNDSDLITDKKLYRNNLFNRIISGILQLFAPLM